MYCGNVKDWFREAVLSQFSPSGRLVLTIDSGLFAMDTIFNDVCVLVTAAFALTRAIGSWLEMSVGDDGQGVPSAEIEQLFFGERPRVHALVLLRRRLRGLFGRSFQLEVQSEIGEGTTVTMRIPFQRLAVNLESKRAITTEVSELAPS
jgi:hypothetical protein